MMDDGVRYEGPRMLFVRGGVQQTGLDEEAAAEEAAEAEEAEAAEAEEAAAESEEEEEGPPSPTAIRAAAEARGTG